MSAALPGAGTAEASSGGAQGAVVPYLSRDPAVSLVQSALTAALREQGATTDQTPVDRSRWSTIASTAEALMHPGNFSPDDPDWVTKIAKSMLGHLAKGNHPFNPRPAERAISGSARLIVVGDWGTGLPSEVQQHVLAYWPVSSEQARAGVTSWSLNGNHDMYSGGLLAQRQRRITLQSQGPTWLKLVRT